ncbi:hypothetical protein IX51_01825 [uncultured archaeon]|nr:hypothetical protein IX51_01825 [uncultured archaeon]
MKYRKNRYDEGETCRSTILTVSLPKEMLATIDEAVRVLKTDRSKAVRYAIEQVYGLMKKE